MKSQVKTHGLALDPETYDPIKEYADKVDRSVPKAIKQMSKAFFGGLDQK